MKNTILNGGAWVEAIPSVEAALKLAKEAVWLHIILSLRPLGQEGLKLNRVGVPERMGMVGSEVEEESASIKALGSLFKLTQIHLWYISLHT